MIWLIGMKGMLGTEVARLFETQGLAYRGTDREVDITREESLAAFAREAGGFSWIVNCAAYTAVDKAEEDERTCEGINRDGAANIAQTAARLGAKLIHISTDYVFNGQGSRPYREDDEPSPLGVYGRTKQAGETAILERHEAAYIIRTAWLYGAYGTNFVTTMLRLMGERDRVQVVQDQRGSPTWAYDLAALILRLIGLGDAGTGVPYGIYHFSHQGDISWFDFAQAIYQEARDLGLLSRSCVITPCTSAEFPAKVTRPAYSVLDKSKIQAALGIQVPAWQGALRAFLATLD